MFNLALLERAQPALIQIQRGTALQRKTDLGMLSFHRPLVRTRRPSTWSVCHEPLRMLQPNAPVMHELLHARHPLMPFSREEYLNLLSLAP